MHDFPPVLDNAGSGASARTLDRPGSEATRIHVLPIYNVAVADPASPRRSMSFHGSLSLSPRGAALLMWLDMVDAAFRRHCFRLHLPTSE
jgi:hypothetical protein